MEWMKVKINRLAAKQLKKMLELKEAEGQMIRVAVSQMHEDHAHYEIRLDTPKEYDEIVNTDKDIDILLDTREEFLDGIWIQYFFVPEEGFVITNSSKSGDRHR